VAVEPVARHPQAPRGLGDVEVASLRVRRVGSPLRGSGRQTGPRGSLRGFQVSELSRGSSGAGVASTIPQSSDRLTASLVSRVEDATMRRSATSGPPTRPPNSSASRTTSGPREATRSWD
jgi:hypothetical protein